MNKNEQLLNETINRLQNFLNGSKLKCLDYLKILNIKYKELEKNIVMICAGIYNILNLKYYQK